MRRAASSMPFFTEHGVIMAASVLNSPKAIEVSVFVVRAFVQLRETIAGHKEDQITKCYYHSAKDEEIQGVAVSIY
jgi:hypothetical protein